MGKVLLALLALLVISMSFSAGWVARGWNDGSTTTTAKADETAQKAVEVAARDAVALDAAARKVEAAADRVQVITRTVTVDSGCTPGAGPVSDALASELREAVR